MVMPPCPQQMARHEHTTMARRRALGLLQLLYRPDCLSLMAALDSS
jgi:hypothetical protein